MPRAPSRRCQLIADPPGHSTNPAGYAYVPGDCDDGATCRVHVAFHGCRQQPARIGDRFYVNAGYNRGADTNRIIVLYPQTINSDLPPVYNPRGCWDWWGYDDPNFAKQSGRQMRVVKSMLDRLASDYSGAAPRPASNLNAESASNHADAALDAQPGSAARRLQRLLCDPRRKSVRARGHDDGRAGDHHGARLRYHVLLCGSCRKPLQRRKRRFEPGGRDDIRVGAATGELVPMVAILP